ncbi:hypothetical protein Ddye_021690 [Dipteronia dyeriana]|uniref:Uncharacterized protein n=1 Tax=Dipteronia dyeriana TaxID=168575 RepID=A0AAD9U348_9ROSI|nr:hypothetical protein Ddye_021690 [Dipteronia dyeriana]
MSEKTMHVGGLIFTFTYPMFHQARSPLHPLPLARSNLVEMAARLARIRGSLGQVQNQAPTTLLLDLLNGPPSSSYSDYYGRSS